MPTGIITGTIAVFAGGLIGATVGQQIPQNIQNKLPMVFGIVSMVMGIVNLVDVASLSVVVLAVIFGLIIGESIGLDKIFTRFGRWLTGFFPMPDLSSKEEAEENFNLFVSIVVLFVFSGAGIYGALNEGMTGDGSILITKAVLDFFSSMIFAITLGKMVSAVAVPQFLTWMLLFFLADLILPFTTEIMRADFSAFGGFLMLANGFNIAKIKQFPVANMIPGFILVMPISYLWTLLF